MKGYVGKESWSRCEQPSMLYDSIRSPNATYVPPKPVVDVAKVDTMESTQARLNRDMVNRLRNIGLQLPHDSFVTVVQVGKYLFLAIMLPPYLLLYGMPRWILLNMLPVAAMEAKAVAITIGKYVALMSKHVKDLMKGILDQLLGDALRLTKHTVKHMLRRVFELFKKVTDAITKNNDQLKSWQDQFHKKSATLIKSIVDNVRQAAETVQKAVAANAKKIADIAHTVGKFVDKHALTPTINFVLPPFQFAGRVASAAGRHVAEAARIISERIKRTANKYISPIAEAAVYAAKTVRKYVSAVVDPVAQWLKERTEALQELASRTWKSVSDPVASAVASATEKAKEIAVAGFDIAGQIVVAVPMGVIGALRWAWGSTPEKRNEKRRSRKEKFERWGRRTKSVARGVVEGLKEIVNGGKRAAVWSLGMLKKLQAVLLKAVRWAVDQMLQLPRHIVKFTKIAGKATGRFLGKVGFAIRLLIAVIWAACYFGIYLLRQTAR